MDEDLTRLDALVDAQEAEVLEEGERQVRAVEARPVDFHGSEENVVDDVGTREQPAGEHKGTQIS